MMSGVWPKVGVLLALFASGAAACRADEPVREQFAYAIPLDVRVGAPVVRMDLPLQVYRDSVIPGLRDLRVLNGAGEVVPHALQPPEAAVRGTPTMQGVPLFALRGEAAVSGAPLQLHIESGETSIQVEGAQPPLASAPITGYLVNTSDLESAISAFEFRWPDETPDFAIDLAIAASNDLIYWHDVVPRAPLARLRQGGDVFEQRSVPVPAERARYWRVSAQAGARLPEIVSVFATLVTASVPVDRKQLEVAGTPVEGQPGFYDFDLGAQLPVDRVALGLPDVNTVAQVAYLSRRTPTEDWRPRHSTSVYRMQSANGELVSQALAVTADAARYWRVQVDPRGGGIGSGRPNLRAGWLPDLLVFVTRGGGPFELVYGSASATDAAVPLERILPAGEGELPAAYPGLPGAAGGPELLLPAPPPRPWRAWVLWIALIAGVATLGALALSLARQMRAVR
jgi:hypothetical protein